MAVCPAFVALTSVKAIYSVFDSTRIPQQWVDIISKHFDIVLVPVAATGAA